MRRDEERRVAESRGKKQVDTREKNGDESEERGGKARVKRGKKLRTRDERMGRGRGLKGWEKTEERKSYAHILTHTLLFHSPPYTLTQNNPISKQMDPRETVANGTLTGTARLTKKTVGGTKKTVGGTGGTYFDFDLSAAMPPPTGRGAVATLTLQKTSSSSSSADSLTVNGLLDATSHHSLSDLDASVPATFAGTLKGVSMFSVFNGSYDGLKVIVKGSM